MYRYSAGTVVEELRYSGRHIVTVSVLYIYILQHIDTVGDNIMQYIDMDTSW